MDVPVLSLRDSIATSTPGYNIPRQQRYRRKKQKQRIACQSKRLILHPSFDNILNRKQQLIKQKPNEGPLARNHFVQKQLLTQIPTNYNGHHLYQHLYKGIKSDAQYNGAGTVLLRSDASMNQFKDLGKKTTASNPNSNATPLSYANSVKAIPENATINADESSELAMSTRDSSISTTSLSSYTSTSSFEENGDLSTQNDSVSVCKRCKQRGHIITQCPRRIWSDILPIKGFTDLHHRVLDETLLRLPEEVGLSDQSLSERSTFICSLESYLQRFFDGAKLELFGSSCNGFGFDQSDLDICMTLSKSDIVPNMVHKIARKLERHKELSDVKAIANAKVPIVKFHINELDLDADISVYNTLAQENTRLLSTYSKIDPRVKILCFCLKLFVKVCDIGDASRGTLSSYAYTLMMLYYLQQVKPPVIPVLQEIWPIHPKPMKTVQGCDVWFMDDLSKLPQLWPEMGQNKMTVATLWLGFLCFYVETFCRRKYVVCIRRKEPLTKLDKRWGGRCLAIEDPFILKHNLGSALTKTMNNFIIKTFMKGRTLYGSPIEDNMELFNKYQTPSDYFFDDKLLSEERPINTRGCLHCGKISHLVRSCPMLRYWFLKR